jgi:hypothetical protein
VEIVPGALRPGQDPEERIDEELLPTPGLASPAQVPYNPFRVGEGPAAQERIEEQVTPIGGVAQPTQAPYNPSRMREGVRGALAFGLLLLLVGIVVGSFALLLTGADPEQSKAWLQVVLTPIVGLVGAATGFYYAERSRSE